jgi:hypothetical protein
MRAGCCVGRYSAACTSNEETARNSCRNVEFFLCGILFFCRWEVGSYSRPRRPRPVSPSSRVPGASRRNRGRGPPASGGMGSSQRFPGGHGHEQIFDAGCRQAHRQTSHRPGRRHGQPNQYRCSRSAWKGNVRRGCIGRLPGHRREARPRCSERPPGVARCERVVADASEASSSACRSSATAMRSAGVRSTPSDEGRLRFAERLRGQRGRSARGRGTSRSVCRSRLTIAS